ncbi:MAG: HAD-IB family hydrolase [Treponema sp.]|nr:HAD-IB family hydrolase [Treponema sp.]
MKTRIFDVDHTVVKKTTAEYFVKIALKEKIIRYSQISHLILDLIKYKLAFPDMDFIEKTVENLAGLKKSDLEHIAEISFQKLIKPKIYKDAAELIRGFINKGERVIFATSTFDFIIKPLEEFFGIEGSLASKMEYSNGITTGKMDGYSFFGPKKKTAAQEWMECNNIHAKDVSFYSDSYTDIPLLDYCGDPVAVNPDRTLKQKAKKLGWQILNFKEVLGN